MTERSYAYRLVVFGKTVYESTIEDKTSPKDALNWGLYWMPGDWTAGDRGEVVHAEVSVLRDGRPTTWKSYWTDYTREASHIHHWTKEDVRCLISGQDLVWQIVDRDLAPVCDRLFSSKSYAEDYMYHTLNRFDFVRHVWVDGWYDEQYSWKREEVKGYENITWEESE